MTNSKEVVHKQIERRMQRMLERKISVMKEENARLERIEKNIKHLAKELGVTLK